MRPDRPHQSKLLAEIVYLIHRGETRILVQLATGGGKTHVGLRLCEMLVVGALPMMTDAPPRAGWFAHRDELVKQPRDRILAEGWRPEDLAIITAGRRSGLDSASLTIASVQTLLTQSDEELSAFLSGLSLIVLDEARHYTARQWARVWRLAKPGTIVVGLDATPVRADGSPLGDIFDRIVTGADVRSLVSGGHLVPSVILAPAAYQDELAQDPVDAYLQHAAGKRAIIFCSYVAQARDISLRLSARGVPAEWLDGNTRERLREDALRRFKAGDVLALPNVRILTEGTDLPPCEVVIHAAKCGSLADWIQKGGRGLRPSPETGKTACKIVDLHGSVHVHGFLDDPHVWSLDGRGVRLAEGLPQIGQCPFCYAWGRARSACASCGREMPEFKPPPPRVKAADLQEIRRKESEESQSERLFKWAVDLARRGKNPWGAQYRFRGTYGALPPREWMVRADRQARETVAREKREAEERAAPLLRVMREAGSVGER